MINAAYTKKGAGNPAKPILAAVCLSIVAIAIVCGLCSCASQNTGTEDAPPVEPTAEATAEPEAPSPSPDEAEPAVTPSRAPQDRTVHFDGFDIEGKTVSQTGDGMADIGTGYLSSESMIEPSGYIVHGSVVNITYTYDSGNAIMFYDVLLDEVWWDRAHEGDSALAAGDKITVFQSGGYIPGDVFSEYRGGRPEVPADSLVMQTIMGIPFPENGAEYVLFLQDSPEPKYDGVFMVTGVYQGRYEVKNGTVSRYCPEKRFAPSDDELYTDNGITLDELREHVLEAIENYQPPQIPTLEEILDNFIAKRQSFVDYEKESAEAIGALEEYEDYLKGLQEPIDKLPAFFSRVLKRNDEIASKTDSHPSVLLLDSSSPNLTYGGDTYTSTLIERAGAVNAAKALRQTDFSTYSSGGAVVTAEQIAEMNPDIIVIANSVNRSSYSADDILSNPSLQDVSAVKDGRVYEAKMTDAWFYSGDGSQHGSTLGLLGVCYLQTLLYPDEYSGAQFKTDVKEYLEIMYSNTSDYQFYFEKYNKRFGE